MSKLLELDLSTNLDKQEFAIDIRDSAIIWVNDIEQDSTYARWSSSLGELLRPTFTGMLRHIRRNLYNVVGKRLSMFVSNQKTCIRLNISYFGRY